MLWFGLVWGMLGGEGRGFVGLKGREGGVGDGDGCWALRVEDRGFVDLG